MSADQVQALLDAVESNGRFDWLTFNEEKAQNLGFGSRKELVACAVSVAEKEGLEVNEFYAGVRYAPTSRVRNVEVGRVVVCTYGPHYGKSMVITDVVDQARVVVMGVDGMLSDIKPQSFPLKRLHMTSIRVPKMSQRGQRLKKVKALVGASIEDIKGQLLKDRVVCRISKRTAKVTMTDFQRFKAWAVKKGL